MVQTLDMNMKANIFKNRFLFALPTALFCAAPLVDVKTEETDKNFLDLKKKKQKCKDLIKRYKVLEL